MLLSLCVQVGFRVSLAQMLATPSGKVTDATIPWRHVQYGVVTWSGGGLYNVSYTLTAAGHYSISVRLMSSLADIQGSPFNVYIGPADMNESMSAVSAHDREVGRIARLAPMDVLHLQGSTQRLSFEAAAGAGIDVLIRAADSFGNVLSNGGALVQARIFAVTDDVQTLRYSCESDRTWILQQSDFVADRLNGTYSFTIVRTQAAVYCLGIRFVPTTPVCTSRLRCATCSTLDYYSLLCSNVMLWLRQLARLVALSHRQLAVLLTLLLDAARSV